MDNSPSEIYCQITAQVPAKLTFPKARPTCTSFGIYQHFSHLNTDLSQALLTDKKFSDHDGLEQWWDMHRKVETSSELCYVHTVVICPAIQ